MQDLALSYILMTVVNLTLLAMVEDYRARRGKGRLSYTHTGIWGIAIVVAVLWSTVSLAQTVEPFGVLSKIFAQIPLYWGATYGLGALTSMYIMKGAFTLMAKQSTKATLPN